MVEGHGLKNDFEKTTYSFLPLNKETGTQLSQFK